MPATDVRIPLPDGASLRAAVAYPDGAGPHPGVVALHEIYGLTDDMRRICSRFADAGYAAAAPDLYSHGNKAICLTKVLTAMVRGSGPTIDDIDSTRKWLADQPEVDAGKIAVIGFCQGGGFALAYAPKHGLQAAAVNYGRVPSKRDAIAGICPVVGSYGKLDRSLRGHADRLDRYLTDLGVPHDIKEYDGVGHSFMNEHEPPGWMTRLPSPMTLGYSKEQAEDAWSRILAFFDEHVKG